MWYFIAVGVAVFFLAATSYSIGYQMGQLKAELSELKRML
jgi:hypothetical protein